MALLDLIVHSRGSSASGWAWVSNSSQPGLSAEGLRPVRQSIQASEAPQGSHGVAGKLIQGATWHQAPGLTEGAWRATPGAEDRVHRDLGGRQGWPIARREGWG